MKNIKIEFTNECIVLASGLAVAGAILAGAISKNTATVSPQSMWISN